MRAYSLQKVAFGVQIIHPIRFKLPLEPVTLVFECLKPSTDISNSTGIHLCAHKYNRHFEPMKTSYQINENIKKACIQYSLLVADTLLVSNLKIWLIQIWLLVVSITFSINAVVLKSTNIVIHLIEWHHICVSSAERVMIAFVDCF